MITCKCGATLHSYTGTKVFIKTTNGKRKIIQSFLCDSCLTWHGKNNLLAYNQKDKDAWLNGGKKRPQQQNEGNCQLLLDGSTK